MKQRPVVAIVCDVIYPYSRGGRELRYHELLPRLAEHAEIHVYTMHWWDGPTTYCDGGVTYHAISKLIPLYTGNRRSVIQALRFGLACLRLLRCHFDVLEADHIPYFQVFALRAVATLKRRPFIATWHEVWTRSYWRHYLGWPGLAAWAIEWLAMQLPDHIIAASPETAERLQGVTRKRTSITTVPNGIDLNAIRTSHPDANISDLVFVGRLISHKRVDMLLDLVALMRKRGFHITCRIIGDGPERAALQERTRRLELTHAVDFRCDVAEQKEVYALVKSSRLFVSLSAREGFGMAVLEAIACGIPVLTTSGADNLAQHLVARYSRGVVCEPALDAVAAAVEGTLAESGEQSDDRYRTDSWLADYEWAAMADRLISVYRADAGGGVSPGRRRS